MLLTGVMFTSVSIDAKSTEEGISEVGVIMGGMLITGAILVFGEQKRFIFELQKHHPQKPAYVKWKIKVGRPEK